MEKMLPVGEVWSELNLIGKDAHDFGHRLFSRDVKNMSLNSGRLSCFLSAEGKVLGLFWLVKLESDLRLFTPLSMQESLYQLIERYHFSEAFEAQKGDVLRSFWSELAEPKAHGEGDCHSDLSFVGEWRNTGFRFDRAPESNPLPEDDSEWLRHRILNLLPRYQWDFDESSLVFDMGFEELCDPGKGCYVGQEVVERVRTRGGKAPRRLASFRLEKEPKALELVKSASGEILGNITRSFIADADSFLALGYVKRGTQEAENLSLENTNSGSILKIL